MTDSVVLTNSVFSMDYETMISRTLDHDPPSASANSDREKVDANTEVRTPTAPKSRRWIWTLAAGCVALIVFLSVGVAGSVGAWLMLPADGQNDADGQRVAQDVGARRNAASNSSNESSATADQNDATAKQHPLDPALRMAREKLEYIQNNIDDYTATIVKRERVDGKLVEEHMFAKVRARKMDGDTIVVPLSAYLKFTHPKSKKGREVIWVENRNDGKLIAHEPGLLNVMRFHLDPEGKFAMMGNRYPITNIGVDNLARQLIEKGERDRQYDECEVKFYKRAKVDDRVCTLIQVKHPEPRPYFDFHIARIFVDDELNVPIRYEAYSWPTSAGEEPVLEEEYTYRDVKINVGLTDDDFDPDNPEYEFP